MARAIGSASTFREIGPFRRRIYKNPTATAATTATGKSILQSVRHGRRQRRRARTKRALHWAAAVDLWASPRGTALVGPRAGVTLNPLAPTPRTASLTVSHCQPPTHRGAPCGACKRSIRRPPARHPERRTTRRQASRESLAYETAFSSL